MEINDKVKVTGTKITGVIVELYGELDRVFTSHSTILLAKVKHDDSDIVREYVINELRKIE